MVIVVCFFFFKQKTAYEMRISDWSSDVCSSDLEVRRNAAREALEDYRRAVFPNYEVAINLYLQRFNAGFRIAGVAPVNARAGSSCTYNVVIKDRKSTRLNSSH